MLSFRWLRYRFDRWLPKLNVFHIDESHDVRLSTTAGKGHYISEMLGWEPGFQVCPPLRHEILRLPAKSCAAIHCVRCWHSKADTEKVAGERFSLIG